MEANPEPVEKAAGAEGESSDEPDEFADGAKAAKELEKKMAALG